ncbi:MAG: PSD1 domain-containing protein [Planctomycetes bacterium]|nr:PSD1 domain-containing protein [Planctomycetota bacterium]
MLFPALLTLSLAAPQDAIDYARDVAPLFEARCVECHGAEKRKAGLRLDSGAAVLAGSDHGEVAVVVPGDLDGSLLWELVTSDDEDERMPPEGAALSADELDVLRRWIVDGARVPAAAPDAAPTHWAWTPPVRPAVPAVGDGWARGDVDRFVLARMQAQGLAPAPEADRATLLRRLSLDLTGLPPTLAELDAFLADAAPGAYERQVERLLASDAYAEHMARAWLDLARYADTNGYEKDERRSMWRWRDWVIEAYARDLGYDAFTVEQLAGDLLPDATLEQRIATGFHRNTMVNAEGGVDPEEYRVAAVVDRVDTTGAVWLGTTLGCARCHSHKYDPISQREYFRVFAYFNSTKDVGPSDQPRLEAPRAQDVAALAARASEVAALEAELATWTPALEAELAALAPAAPRWRVLAATEAASRDGATLTKLADGSVLVAGESPERDALTLAFAPDADGAQQLRIEVLPDDAHPRRGPGRAGNGNFVLSELRAFLVDEAGARTPLALADARADYEQPGWPAAGVVDGDAATGWAVDGGIGRAHQWVARLAVPLPADVPARLELELDEAYGGRHTIGRLRVSLSNDAPSGAALLPPDVEDLLARREGLADAERETLRAWFRGQAAALAPARERLAALRALPGPPTTLVMEELPAPRATHVLERGSFLAPGEEVACGVPAVMGPLPDDAPANRLGFARWLVSGAHPLTARVEVNRLWAQLFGRGLVTTEQDFGTQGATPTHPALLDWLAVEFVERGWSTKALLRELVTSATYRQDSRVSADALARDPANVWLARGARYRVDAEVVRDTALALSGLLDRTVGGPSVFPPQVPGIWRQTYSDDRWSNSDGGDRFRRGLYTFWRRTAPYPTFVAFDAPSREVVCTRRSRSNTPLQALALLNDPAYVELAVGLAARALREGPQGDRARLAWAFRLCTARAADAAELDVLAALLDGERAHFAADPDAAAALVRVPFELDRGGADDAELAAWTLTANVLLNLAETVTRS